MRLVITRFRGGLLGAALAVSLSSAASAGEPASWTLSGGYSRTFLDDDAAASDIDAVSFSLERALGATSFGLGGGLSWRDFTFQSAVDPVDVSGFSVGGWASHEFSSVSAGLSVDYAKEKGDFVIASPFSSTIPASGESSFLSVGTSFSRVFGDVTRIAPAASFSWSRVETSASIDPAAPMLAVLEGSIVNDGISGSIGVSFAHDFSDRFTFYAGAAGAASDNIGAVYQTPGGSAFRYSGPRTLGEGGSEEWAEFSGGVITRLKRVSLAVDLTGTAGLQQDYVTLSVSTSIGF